VKVIGMDAYLVEARVAGFRFSRFHFRMNEQGRKGRHGWQFVEANRLEKTINDEPVLLLKFDRAPAVE